MFSLHGTTACHLIEPPTSGLDRWSLRPLHSRNSAVHAKDPKDMSTPRVQFCIGGFNESCCRRANVVAGSIIIRWLEVLLCIDLS